MGSGMSGDNDVHAAAAAVYVPHHPGYNRVFSHVRIYEIDVIRIHAERFFENKRSSSVSLLTLPQSQPAFSTCGLPLISSRSYHDA
jgi:hypothetical protein